jgi:hypothetical protein
MLQVTPVYLIALICMSVAHYCSRVYIKVLVSLIVVILALYLNGIILGSGSNAIKLFSAQLGQIFDKNVFVLLDEILTYFVSIVGLLRLVTTILLIVIVKNIFWNKNALKLTIKRITFYFILILSLVGVYAYMLTNESEYDQQFVGSIGIGNNVENTDFSKLSASSTEVFTKAKGLNSQKNVVVLMVDSLSSFKSALYGGDNLMPQLDAIAKDNVYFSNFYAPSYNNEIALEQFFTGKPYLHNNSDLASKNYYETTIPKEMKNHGYQSFVMYSSDISETEEIQLKNVGFDFTVDHLDEYYTSAHQRYDRNSIDTKVFLDHAAQRIEYWIRDSKYKKNTMKVFVTLIASFSASPYLVPVELRNNPQALEYDLDKVTKFNDDAIANFVRTLENQGFFKDGILIITGNYRAQVPVTQKEFDKYGQAAAIRVPCIIIDKSLPINVHEYKNDISALSLSEIIYYLTLDTYRSSSMRVNPFVDKYDNELIIYQKSAPRNEIFLKKGDTTGRFLINGNRSKIVGNLQDKQTNFGDVLYLLKEKVYNDDVPLKQENIELIEEQIQPKEDNKVIEQSSETTDKEDLGESLVLVESSENVVVQETTNDEDDEKYKEDEDEKEPEVIETNESSDEVKNAEVLQVTESSEGQEFSESVVVQESEASSSEE